MIDNENKTYSKKVGKIDSDERKSIIVFYS